MTRSKLDLATILAKLRADGSDPSTLAKEMTFSKLCCEIQKIEDEEEESVKTPTPTPTPPAPEPQPKKKKNILSWLLDASDDDEC